MRSWFPFACVAALVCCACATYSRPGRNYSQPQQLTPVPDQVPAFPQSDAPSFGAPEEFPMDEIPSEGPTFGPTTRTPKTATHTTSYRPQESALETPPGYGPPPGYVELPPPPR